MAFAFLSCFNGLYVITFDIFGSAKERKMERGLINNYEAQMHMVADKLTPANHAAAVELASYPTKSSAMAM